MLRQDSCGGSYCSKNLILKFETKKELRISPPIICPDLKTQDQDKLEHKKSMKHFHLKPLGSVALHDQSTHWFSDFQTITMAGKYRNQGDKTLCLSGPESLLAILKACNMWTHRGTLWAKLHSKKRSLTQAFYWPTIYKIHVELCQPL
ncbi:hypothetical protein Tco_1215381 [Tanacetum coccineum]